MSDVIVCPSCQARYPARADLYGRQVVCKRCQQPFVPEAPPPAMDYALAGLLDEADEERAAAEERARIKAEEEGEEKSRKRAIKKANKLRTSRKPRRGDGVNDKTHMIIICCVYGLPTLLGILTLNPTILGCAGILSLIAVQINSLAALIIYCGENDDNTAVILSFFFCGPLFLIWMISYYAANSTQHRVFLTHVFFPPLCLALIGFVAFMAGGRA